jgi:uncharacterized protein YgbK (DUF1537 family)
MTAARAGALLPQGPLVAWYGDDFTGSAAVMEVLAFSGLSSILFLDLPCAEDLARFADRRGIGIAGTARAHSPAWMEAELPRVFETLAAIGATVTHYKICSTLDSAPHVGSIGKAIDLAVPVLRPGLVPVLVAAPAIRRYQAFGQLFAAGPDGRIHRLDRHPVMARHPVTPMDEADVARHLARQTTRRIGLVDLVALQASARADAELARLRGEGAEIVLLDTVDERSLAQAGRLIWAARGARVLAVGSQGVEYALVAHWREEGLIEAVPPPGSAGAVARLVVVSGSVSATTAAQIDWALAHGFAGIAFLAEIVLADAQTLAAAEARAVAAALDALGEGRDVLVYTARGPDDPAVARYNHALAASGTAKEAADARIGAALGRILAQVLAQSGVARAVISGGDTSGFAARALGIRALEALSPTIPGAALFRAHGAAGPGIEIALKGGQMGSADYFGWIKRGGGPPG